MAAEQCDGLECYVSLRIAGSSLDFDSIERALKRTGTKRHRAGEKFALGVRAVDEWSLSTPFPPSESHLDVHIDWLRQVLKSSAPFLKSLASKADVSIYCGFSLFSEISYATLSPSSFSFIADLGVPLQLALFCLPEAVKCSDGWVVNAIQASSIKAPHPLRRKGWNLSAQR